MRPLRLLPPCSVLRKLFNRIHQPKLCELTTSVTNFLEMNGSRLICMDFHWLAECRVVRYPHNASRSWYGQFFSSSSILISKALNITLLAASLRMLYRRKMSFDMESYKQLLKSFVPNLCTVFNNCRTGDSEASYDVLIKYFLHISRSMIW